MKNELTEKSRSLLIFVICYVLFASCELFNTSADSGFFDKIDEEIAWANAERLAVTVDFPPEWGISPQRGDGSRDTIRLNERPRLGYGFDVEFSPLPGFGFEQWLVIYTEDYAALDKTKSVHEEEISGEALEAPDVFIEIINEGLGDTGTISARFIVNVGKPVTVVPWCNDRPRLDTRTNPPISPILSPFPYDQPVNIWFTVPIIHETVVLGETITISANYSSGPNLGELFREHGNITDYFTLGFPADNRISLTPNPNTALDLALLSIRIIVGPGIQNTNGIMMSSSQEINYQTDTREAQKAYRAVNIRASRRENDGYFSDSIEFPFILSMDRRFNLGHTETDRNFDTVYLRFTVDAPEDAPSINPNRVLVIEDRAYNLRGFNAEGGVQPKAYDDPPQAGGVFTIAHKIATTQSGVLRLIILPCWHDDDEDSLILNQNTAVSEGMYVSIVLDLAAPGVDVLDAALSEPSARESDTVYVYGPDVPMTLTLDGLTAIADNGIQGGVPQSRAWDIPWTMEGPENLSWYVRIGSETQTGRIESGRLGVYVENTTSGLLELNNTWSLDDLEDLLEGYAYPIFVRFEDSLGNLSDWVPTGLSVKFSTDEVNAVSNLRAAVNPDGDSITITWNEPNSYLYPELIVNRYRSTSTGLVFEDEIVRNNFDREKSAGSSLTVPQIISNRVREGDAVSNVYGYEITVIAHNTAGTAVTGPLWVFNIPEMAVSQANPLVMITSAADFAAIPLTTVGLQFVLLNDITINSNSREFSGSFYGNGHSITINGITGADHYGGAYGMGLFGMLSEALVRDLTVLYSSSLVISADTFPFRFGGIAGFTVSYTRIINCIVGSSAGIGQLNPALVINAQSSSGTVHIGGIAGSIPIDSGFRGGIIENCLASLSLTYNAYVAGLNSQRINIGGIAGVTIVDGRGSISFDNGISTITLNDVLIDGVTIRANVSANLGINLGNLHIGGAVGESGRNTMHDIDYAAGQVSFSRTASPTQPPNNFVGGLIGNANSTNLINSTFRGEITTINNNPVNGNTRLGGLIGENSVNLINPVTIYIHNSVSNGNLSLNSSGSRLQMFVGGLMGSSTVNLGPTLTITDCIFEDGNISITGVDTISAAINAGGFAGILGGHGAHDISTSGAMAGNIIINATNGLVCAGGFVSQYNGNISNCFSGINIISNGIDSSHYTGGFIGQLGVEGSITGSFATGSVRTTANGDNSNIYAGGLVGESMGSISNSYALGNVMADHQGGTAHFVLAGGLTGYTAYGNIDNCFARGQVSVQSAATLLTFPAIRVSVFAAGGLVGYREEMPELPGFIPSVISNSAALGPSVTLKTSSSTRGVGRIYGFPATDEGVNNFALATMVIAEDSDYTTLDPQIRSAVSGPATPDGVNVAASVFLNPATWTGNTPGGLGFNSGGNSPAGTWNFLHVGIEGFPRLAWE